MIYLQEDTLKFLLVLASEGIRRKEEHAQKIEEGQLKAEMKQLVSHQRARFDEVFKTFNKAS